MNKHKSWQDQTAIITGASSGLGKAIAIKLAGLGVKLALIDLDASGLEAIQTEVSVETMIFPLDITAEDRISSTVSKIENHFGSIEILVNSAGIAGQTNRNSHEINSEDLQRVFDVNFKGSWLMSKHVVPGMLKRKYGRILHIASIAGKEGNAGMLAYSASKAAVIGMTKVQGKEYAETGITVNALAPAVIQTNMVDKLPETQVKYMTDKIPMKRCGSLDELANMVAFIISPDNSFSTGFTFDLSGGRATY